MKKLMRRSLVLSSVLIPGIAAAEEAATGLQLTPSGEVWTSLNLLDSTNQKGFNGKFERLLLGVSGKDGAGQGKAELEFTDGTTKVRQSWVGLKFSNFAVNVGRVRPMKADYWAPDSANYNSSGFGSLDGLQLDYAISLGEKNSVGFGLVSANSLTVAGGLQSEATSDKATVVYAAAAVANASVKLGYGMQKNMLTAVARPGDPTSRTTGIANASQLEFSAGYALNGVSFGLWQSSVTQDKTVDFANANGKLKADAASKKNRKSVKSVTGLGAVADSSLFSLNDVFSKGGLLTYSFSYAMDKTTLTGADYADAEKAAAKDAALSQIALGFGWKNAAFLTELNVVMNTAKGKIYDNAKGTEKVKGQTVVQIANYLTI